MGTISADLFVDVIPGVIAAGGSALDLNGVMLSTSTRVPIGTVMSFPDGASVEEYFGSGSREDQAANGGLSSTGVSLGSGYFGGFDTSTVKPAAMLFTQYPAAAVSAYLRGGNVSALTLTQLQAFSGTLGVVIDGVSQSSAVNLSGVTSFTNAAQLIETDLAISGVQTGTVTATIAGTVLTVSAVLTGGTPIAVGNKITGASVTTGTFIASLGTGTGGAGTYNLSQAVTEATPETMTLFKPAVVFDSVSGAFIINSGTTGASSTLAYATGAMATDLLLTLATGAVLSQGAIAATPGAFMDGVVRQTKNWASFTTLFNPDASSSVVNRLAFASWVNSQKGRYGYMAWDTTVDAATVVPATDSLAYAVTQANLSGTVLLWEVGDTNIGPMACGFIASVNYQAEGGRVAFAGKSQTGMTPSVTDDLSAVNLGGNPQVIGSFGNGYNYYGAVGTANAQFQNFQRGSISGPFKWVDTYFNQIKLNSDLQLSLMTLQSQVNSIPFNSAGDGLIEAALADPIESAISFGSIVAGVALTNGQIAAINALAGGTNIASTIQNQGWYLLIKPASGTVRQARGPRAITFFYSDGESVQSISLSSLVVL